MTTNQKPADLISVPTVEGEPILYRPSGELFRYEVDAETYKPTHEYTSGEPVLEATDPADALAQSVGWQLIESWARSVGDQKTSEAATQLLHDWGSRIPTDETGLEFAEPFGQILEYANNLTAPVEYVPGVNLTRLQWDPSWTVQELSSQVRTAANQSWGKGCAYTYTLGHDHDGVDIKLVKRG